MEHSNVLPEDSLAALAIRLPAASRIFRRAGLDYCCGGNRSLEAACRARNLDPRALLQEIQAASQARPEVDWSRAALPDLVEHILSRYHAPLRAELPELVAMARKVEAVHADKPTVPSGLHAHLEAMHAEVLDHLAKEEAILFPAILAGQGRRAAGPVRVMEHEHRDHGRNLARVRELTADLTPPAEACTTWRALYLRLADLESELMEHIHLENNVLFPRALCE